jgi:hypothetical protein
MDFWGEYNRKITKSGNSVIGFVKGHGARVRKSAFSYQDSGENENCRLNSTVEMGNRMDLMD